MILPPLWQTGTPLCVVTERYVVVGFSLEYQKYKWLASATL